MSSQPVLLALGFFLLSLWASAADYEDAPFHYWSKPPQDPVARFQERLRTGAARLPAGDGPATLRAVLDYFKISPATQVLVYSKTSAQNSRISPQRPRAIYFSDDLYIGWVQDGGIEILSFDPELGALCYYLDIPGASPEDPSFITRPQICMDCHVRSSTGGVPGGLIRSVFPGPTGMPYFQAGSHTVDHSTPLEHRWGGWYVTGSAGHRVHRGNSLAEETTGGEIVLRSMVKPDALPLKDLTLLIDATAYPGGSTSDIVALMVLEHQIQLHNVLVSANTLVRRLRYQTDQLRAHLDEAPLSAPEGTLARVLETEACRIVDALLFKDEFQMENDGIEGSPAFLEAFAANRRRGSDGRSLKDFRLYENLFKNRCSYAIYSQPFEHLTPWLKAEVYRQLIAALKLPQGTSSSAHLSPKERSRILAILRETKEDFPAG